MHPFPNNDENPDPDKVEVEDSAEELSESDKQEESTRDDSRLQRLERRMDQLCDSFYGNGVRPPLPEPDEDRTYVHYSQRELDEMESKKG